MEPLPPLLTPILRRAALDDEVALIFLKELWTDMVGAELGGRTCPHSLRNKRLTLNVPSEIWANELNSLRHRLLEAINGFWGIALVQRIELRVENQMKHSDPSSRP